MMAVAHGPLAADLGHRAAGVSLVGAAAGGALAVMLEPVLVMVATASWRAVATGGVALLSRLPGGSAPLAPSLGAPVVPAGPDPAIQLSWLVLALAGLLVQAAAYRRRT